MSPDLLNAAFEAAGVAFLTLSVKRLHREKRVAGVSPIHVAFFCVWGYWNLFYYPSLGQWWSAAAAGALALLQTVWLGQLIYYSRRG